MSQADYLQAGSLRLPGLAHAFFTRRGGVSQGLYASLNGGLGSRDDPALVIENRARMAAALGISPGRLLVPYLTHSSDVVAVSAPWSDDERPRCDGLATTTPDLALGVTGADCGILLFADMNNCVIGAAHAGWRGALNGILESTIAAMTRLGARVEKIRVALGPTIAQASYEVGPEFVSAFVAREPAAQRFFVAGVKADRAMFDLHGFIAMRLARAGVGGFEDLGVDTYADEERCFSFRRMTHRGEADYGRMVAAITLAGANATGSNVLSSPAKQTSSSGDR
jgi:polyphenol oxidase